MRAGFTLIEALIAVGLGAILVGTAVSAVRAASQTVTVANRLAIENAMLRIGVGAAHEEVDFWRGYDDPLSASRPLRAANGALGLPFTPMRDVWPAASGTAGAEDDTTWRQDEKAWDPSDPRTWYRGNLPERSTSKMWFGRYAIFSTTHTTPPDIGTFSSPVDAAQSVCYTGAPEAHHHWYPFQIQTLRDALGFYALCDYAPPNAIYSTFDPGADYTLPRNGAITDWFVRTGPPSPNGNFRVYELVHARVPPGKYRCTAKSSFAVINPATAGASPASLQSDTRYCFGIGNREANVGSPNEVRQFLDKTDVPDPLLKSGRPTTWPNATVSVSHFIKNARPITICKVRVVSPVTGNAMALTFSGWGTTLRGARLQRGRDGGWATWDNAGGANPPTLDDR